MYVRCVYICVCVCVCTYMCVFPADILIEGRESEGNYFSNPTFTFYFSFNLDLCGEGGKGGREGGNGGGKWLRAGEKNLVEGGREA